MDPPASHRITRVLWYSGYPPLVFDFAYGTFTLSGSAFQPSSTISNFDSAGPQPRYSVESRFGLIRVRSPLLTESNFFLFLRLLRCFSSPGSPRYTIYSCNGDGPLRPPGFPIRISMDQCLLTAPHGFSQLTASFFGS